MNTSRLDSNSFSINKIYNRLACLLLVKAYVLYCTTWTVSLKTQGDGKGEAGYRGWLENSGLSPAVLST